MEDYMGQSDVCLKRYLSNNERFADLVNGILGEGERLLSADDLTDMDSQVGYHEWDRPGYRDLFKKASFGVNFLVMGVEHQEVANYLMPLRCMIYDAKEYGRQAAVEKSKVRRWKKIRHSKKSGEKISQEEFLSDFWKESRLHPCITLVLFFGKCWDAGTSLHDLLDFSGIPPKLLPFVNDYNMYMIPVRELENTEVFQTDLKMVFDCIRYGEDREMFRQKILENPQYTYLDEDAYDLIARYTKLLGNKEIAMENVVEGGKVNMCKAMQELMEESRVEGFQEGIREGIKEGILALINMCKEFGLSQQNALQRILQTSSVPQEVAESWVAQYW